MNQDIAIPPPVDFKDRKTGLVIFGILTLCLGGLCALMVLLLLAAESFAETSRHSPRPAGAGVCDW